MGEPRQAWILPVVLVAAGALGGCVAGTEVSYGQYQYDPYGGTERVYERSVSVDPGQGVRTETCQTTVRKHFSPYGGEFERRTQVCDETPRAYGGEPLPPGDVPPSVYRAPDRQPLPPAAIPD